MKNYWYKHFLKQRSHDLTVSKYPIEWLQAEFNELKQLQKEGFAYRHNVLYFYNPEDKAYLEGLINALSTLLGENQQYFFKDSHF